METNLTRTESNSIPPALQPILQKPIVKLLQTNQLDKAISLLPSTVNEAVKGTPIATLMRVVSVVKIEATIAVMLTRLMAMVNVDERLNLQSHQIPFIAKQLILNFRSENLADFNVCFQRGACGFYGQIFRIDAAVITDWMHKYLEEKYQVVESNLMAEKESPYDLNNSKASGNGKNFLDLLIEATGYTDDIDLTDNNAKENAYQREKLANDVNPSLIRLKDKAVHIEWFLKNYDATKEEAEDWFNKLIEKQNETTH